MTKLASVHDVPDLLTVAALSVVDT